MPQRKEPNQEEIQAERPLECGECKKPIAVRYLEISKNHEIITSMCADCPELEKKLHGFNQGELAAENSLTKTGVACGNCGTTLQAVRVGTPLGCPHCYEVFKEVIISELVNVGKIPLRIANSKKNAPLHLGRTPGELPKINPSAQLIALNEALIETLKQEDYEQAALLRDQIKALTKKQEEGSNEKQ